MPRFRTPHLLALAALLVAPGAALAGAVTPTALQGDFFFDDTTTATMNCSNVQIEGTTHQVNGTATGVGLDNDTVTIAYSTPFTDKLNARPGSGQLAEKTQSQIDVDIASGGGAAANYSGTANPERGKVVAKVTQDGTRSKVFAHFQVGSDLSGLTPVPDADQLATILDAFADRNDVRINGGVRVIHRGQTAPGGTCP